jgi:hypothetical protein
MKLYANTESIEVADEVSHLYTHLQSLTLAADTGLCVVCASNTERIGLLSNFRQFHTTI